MKPRNKQELVDGIKKFWRKKVTPKKCGKYIDHGCTRQFQLWLRLKALQQNIKTTALLGATVPCFVEFRFNIAL